MAMYSYPGYAFTEGWREKQKKISDRYKELCDQGMHEQVKVNRFPAYGHTKFTVKALTEEAKKLSLEDVLIIADHGNLCFGGECNWNDSQNHWQGSYSVD